MRLAGRTGCAGVPSWPRRRRRCLRVTRWLQPGMNVLEIGSGGRFTHVITGYPHLVIDVDGLAALLGNLAGRDPGDRRGSRPGHRDTAAGAGQATAHPGRVTAGRRVAPAPGTRVPHDGTRPATFAVGLARFTGNTTILRGMADVAVATALDPSTPTGIRSGVAAHA